MSSRRRLPGARLRAEQVAWDREAAARAPEEVDLGEQGWADVIARLLDAAGPLSGRRVLDCGCGRGALSRAAAARGAEVVGVDVSERMLHTAVEAGGAAAYLLADLAALPLAPASVDAAVGMFVLHHVDLAAAADELARVLRPGGRGVFLETWQRNPLIRAARRLRGRTGIARHGTPDERPLVPADLDLLRRAGFVVEVAFPAFMLFRLFDNNILRGRVPLASRILRAVDVALDRVRPLRPWGYYVAVLLTRR